MGLAKNILKKVVETVIPGKKTKESPASSYAEGVTASTRSKVEELLSPIMSHISTVKSWVKKGMNFLGMGEKEEAPVQPEELVEETRQKVEELVPEIKEESPAPPEETEKVKQFKNRFLEISNNFREKFAREKKITLKHPRLVLSKRLEDKNRMAYESADDLATRIDQERANAANENRPITARENFAYHNQAFMDKNGLVENHVEGSIETYTPEKALEDLFNSDSHLPALLLDTDSPEIGIAITEGISLKGEPVMHVQMVYSGSQGKLEKLDRSEIPDPDDLPKEDTPKKEGKVIKKPEASEPAPPMAEAA